MLEHRLQNLGDYRRNQGSARQAAGVGGMDWGCLCREVAKQTRKNQKMPSLVG